MNCDEIALASKRNNLASKKNICKSFKQCDNVIPLRKRDIYNH